MYTIYIVYLYSMQNETSYKQEIKNRLLNGENFSNESAVWFTVNRINKDGVMCISVGDSYHNYYTILTYTNAVVKLTNTGSL